MKDALSSEEEHLLPLPSALARPPQECSALFWAPRLKKDKQLLQRVQQRAMEIRRGLQYLSFEERLRELDQCSLKR